METAASNPDNVVALTEQIVRDGPSAMVELERKRKIVFRAFEISTEQMENDATEIEKAAILGEHPMKKRHEMMRTAEALRIAAAWLSTLIPVPATEPETQAKT